ncbi:PilZ domain-containing protein [Vibrio sp. 99-70-13A1]|uniref:PilZ domain-containing protein n=1 Tax=Vibrio sp. 99-70-13A1 TaxID=2607601 RepID=UPI001493D655|nr:PilZ domain-containing protein [Vibrio sp. 99-70-13A1]NOH98923.1 PilZ domain-containing protein [Vibrio sp. 99-70-13A1]
MVERRRFSRIIYQVPAKASQDQLQLNGFVQDLSLHGVLLQCDDALLFNHSLPLHVSFQLNDSDVVIKLEASIISTNNTSMRLRIEHLDIDSISHLKRLVELNVGDDELLHREIEHLSDLGS